MYLHTIILLMTTSAYLRTDGRKDFLKFHAHTLTAKETRPEKEHQACVPVELDRSIFMELSQKLPDCQRFQLVFGMTLLLFPPLLSSSSYKS